MGARRLALFSYLPVAPREGGSSPCPAVATFWATGRERAILDDLLPKAMLQCAEVELLSRQLGCAEATEPGFVHPTQSSRTPGSELKTTMNGTHIVTHGISIHPY